MSETIIYWAPAYQSRDHYDLNHLYATPKSIYEEIAIHKAPLKDVVSDDYLRCPATSKFLKNTFVVRAPVDTHANLNFKTSRANHVIDSPADERTYKVKLNFTHQPTLINRNLIDYSHPILFFSEEESMIATLTSPYFEKVSSYDYGTIIPGQFDIGKWFRPMNFEFQLWEGVDSIKISAGEALGYINFQTDKKIILKRFNTTRDMDKLISSILDVSPFKKFARLSDRYKVFEQSQSKQKILKLIQKQLY